MGSGMSTRSDISPSGHAAENRAAIEKEREEEEKEERIALAIIEAEHADRTLRTAAAHTEPPSSEGVFSHMPEPLREPMRRVTELTLCEETHTAFATFCSVDKNKKMEKIVEQFRREGNICWSRYWPEMAKCKNLSQWKGRANADAVGCPIEATIAVRTPECVGRLLAVKWIAQYEGVADASLKSKTHWISAELVTWLEA